MTVHVQSQIHHGYEVVKLVIPEIIHLTTYQRYLVFKAHVIERKNATYRMFRYSKRTHRAIWCASVVNRIYLISAILWMSANNMIDARPDNYDVLARHCKLPKQAFSIANDTWIDILFCALLVLSLYPLSWAQWCYYASAKQLCQ